VGGEYLYWVRWVESLAMKITRFEDIEAWQQASLILSFECLIVNYGF